MRKFDYQKMKDNDFAKSREPFYNMPQEAKISYTDSGSVKITFRGDQPRRVAIAAIVKVLESCEYDLLGNAALYFYPVGRGK